MVYQFTSWSELANENELDAELVRWPYIKGEIDGRLFEMGSSWGRTSSGRATLNQANTFYVKVNLKGDIPEGLLACKRGLLQEAGPVQLGNADFNKKIWVDCPNIEAAKIYLTPERQNALLQLSKYEGIVRGPQNGEPAYIFHSRTGYKLKKEWLEERKNAFLSAANKFDK